MAANIYSGDKFEQLRKQAEEFLKQYPDNTEIPSNMLEVIHELKVHQKELEIQNEELNRSQQELTELYHKYEDLYESAPVGYITLDSKGIISGINKTAAKILGKDKKHVTGSSFTDFIHSKWIDPFLQIQRETGQTGENQSTEVPLKSSANQDLWVHVDMIADRNTNAEVNNWKLTLADITIRKNYEKELIEAKEKAKESDRLKTAFLANMSHEIRTPMNGILGFVELLKKPKISDTRKTRFIDTIIQSGNHLLNIINDLIDISKIETGRIEIYTSRININEELKNLITFFKRETDNKGLKLSYNAPLPPEKATIITDSDKLHSIWINLIKNAIKYTDQGSVEFGYHLTDDTLNCYVQDTGIGISKEEQVSIFNYFTQVEQRGSKVQEGTGLGLAISKAYVNALGGDIYINSEKNKGACFTFTIPYKPAEIADNKEKHVMESSVDWMGKKILIVEDDTPSQIFLKEIFLPTEAEIIIAETGKKGIQEFQRHTDMDLALIDIRLPDINGLKVIRNIKQINSKIPVIAQTAYAKGEDRNKCINAGADDYIAKPIDRMEMLKMIDKYISE